MNQQTQTQQPFDPSVVRRHYNSSQWQIKEDWYGRRNQIHAHRHLFIQGRPKAWAQRFYDQDYHPMVIRSYPTG